MIELVNKLAQNHSLTHTEYCLLLDNITPELTKYIAQLARAVREKYYGKSVFIRGLIEIGNICKNDCYYCGIRRSNQNCERYRLNEHQILDCCKRGYELGFRTFVMQGGEDAAFSDEFLVPLIKRIKCDYPDCAVTLSLGERSRESYMALKKAGADRYLLRHETIDKTHYSMLHPTSLSHKHRIECLYTLRECGYQVGCGFMVGTPYQTNAMLASELEFVSKFKPEMCGIGPFIPHKDTEFYDKPHGSVSLTLFLLSCIRLIHPTVLLPATTALNTLSENGRVEGIMAGANVIMPNLSPAEAKEKYKLYNNKKSTGAESADQIKKLEKELSAIGYHITVSRGDVEDYV